MGADGGVDPDTLGRATWTFLHTLAANVSQNPSTREQAQIKRFMGDFSQLYPCAPCAESFREILKSHPVDVRSGPDFAQWMCSVHNEVNKELNKPVFDCAAVGERWGVCEQCRAHQDNLQQFKNLIKMTQPR